MKKVTWIVENLTNEPSYSEMIDEIKKQGLDVIVIKGGFKYSDISGIDNQCVMVLGSIEMVKLIQKELPSCYPVSYCNFEKYKCTSYYSYFGEYLFNDRYSIMSLSELARQKFFYYGTFGRDALMFLRPDSGDKEFQAQLMDFIDIDSFVKRNEHIKHQLVLVSTPKNIVGEWRYVVTKDKEILGMSTYQYQGQISKIPSAPKEATQLVETILDVGYYPDSVFCIDICQGYDEKYYLLELTSFSSAGLYACKKENIVKRVSEIALKEYNEITR